MEYFEIFQPFDSLYTNNIPVITDQPEVVISSDDQIPVSPEKESPLNLQLDENSLDLSTQHNVAYDQLPSPRLFRPSLSFPGKKTTKFIWTSGHFRILCDVLEFAWGIIENWKRFYIAYTFICYFLCKGVGR